MRKTLLVLAILTVPPAIKGFALISRGFSGVVALKDVIADRWFEECQWKW